MAVFTVGSGVAVAREEPETLLLCALALAVLLNEGLKRVCVGAERILVKRPPLPTRVIPARDIDCLVRLTPSQVLVYARGRRRAPIRVTYLGNNVAEVEAALLELAARHDIPVKKDPIYLEMAEET